MFVDGSDKRKKEDSFTNRNTYTDLFGNYENREPYSTICHKESCIAFQDKFKAIHEAGRHNGLQYGETLQLVLLASNGRYMDEIPYEELNDILRYVEWHSEESMNVSNPLLYGYLKHLKYFEKFPKQMASKDEISSAMQKIGYLLGKKAEWRHFYDLAVTLMNECD